MIRAILETIAMMSALAAAFDVERRLVEPEQMAPDYAMVDAFTGGDCVALAVYAEARNQSWQGQAAVAQVVINRARRPEWPDSYCEVIEEEDQFHGIRDWPFPRTPWLDEPEAWRLAVEVSGMVMREAPMEACTNATHFWKGPTPDWAKGMPIVCRIGAHTFAYEEPR